MSTYFNAREFLGDAFDLVLKHLNVDGKRYENEIKHNPALQRFMVDLTLLIDQTIQVAVSKHDVENKIVQVEAEMRDMKRVAELYAVHDDPMIH